MIDEKLLRQILLNATAQKEFFTRLRKKEADSETILRIFDRAGDLIIEQRNFLERTIEALQLDDNMQKGDMIKSIQKQITGGEYDYIGRMKGIEKLWDGMDHIIGEFKNYQR